jgi:ankyrin repeat protein
VPILTHSRSPAPLLPRISPSIQSLHTGVDVNFEDSMGMTALHWACDRGHLDLAVLLLDHGAEVNAEDECGTTPLHVACTCDHVDVVELMLSRVRV